MNTKEEIIKVKEVFSQLYQREIDDVEALEIFQNLNGFFDLLIKIEKQQKYEGVK